MSESDVQSVRRRPGLYLGGTDERALHKLPEEILNNAFAEAVTTHADLIEIRLKKDGSILIADNGRGIPIELHPKFPGKPALEVIFTTIHLGRNSLARREFQPANASITVRACVVNALSDWLWVEVVRNNTLYRQSYSKGNPTSKLVNEGPTNERRGTTVCFRPDPEIFGDNATFNPAILYEMAQSRAMLYGGVEIRWVGETEIADGKTPSEQSFHYPNRISGAD
ncbi:MAG: hypothetical protein IT560_12455 [Alphaproteobacteria bacterium]|nr:hypothetical protein [Alphaproteobacteria bacterium]